MAEKGTHRENFEAFSAAHPSVLEALLVLTRQMKNRGFKKYSIMTLYGVVRYQLSLHSGEDYKLNNNHMPYYAREIMSRDPELEGFFDLREVKS